MSSSLLHPPASLLAGAPTGPAPAFQRPHRPAGVIAIVAAHAAVVWLLLQGDVVQQAVHQVSPLVVALLTEAAPPPPAQPAPPAPPRPTPPLPATALLPPPALPVADAPPAPAPAPTAVVASVVPPAMAVAAVAAAAQPSPAPAAAVPAPVQVATAPPAPPVLAASAIRYRVPPAIAVPMASRRLGESGTVLLRVWVDAQGLPRQVSLHRSSGFARLDEQALAAMRQARFEPLTDGGSAIEWVVIAPLQYQID